jgi:2-iminoacetate synthase
MNKTSFADTLAVLTAAVDSTVEKIGHATPEDVASALEKIPVNLDGFTALLSTSADAFADRIRNAARELTAQRFGRVVNLYKPLYLSNACVNACLYCGFNASMDIRRRTLTLDEVECEGAILRSEGYASVLLVAGEDGVSTPVSLIEESVRLLKGMGFSYVGVEVAPLTIEQYTRLGEAGLDGVTVYQETYDRDIYRQVHPGGPKRNFDWRLATAERAAKAGIRNIGLGFLLGLGDYRREALALYAHVRFMQKTYWQTSISVSFPRLHHTPVGFAPKRHVSDVEIFRLITATRLANPDVTLTLSTRESPALRDSLFGVGINHASAGSKTSPGAYSSISLEETAGEQFPVVDGREPAEVARSIKKLGLEGVWKDWDPRFRPVVYR